MFRRLNESAAAARVVVQPQPSMSYILLTCPREVLLLLCWTRYVVIRPHSFCCCCLARGNDSIAVVRLFHLFLVPRISGPAWYALPRWLKLCLSDRLIPFWFTIKAQTYVTRREEQQRRRCQCNDKSKVSTEIFSTSDDEEETRTRTAG